MVKGWDAHAYAFKRLAEASPARLAPQAAGIIVAVERDANMAAGDAVRAVHRDAVVFRADRGFGAARV